ncbi:hypothetical protein CHLRE_16g675630v5 [Chlamydomonas reinhardtii]|uniref:Uncharacterized protein n=1 Tax=Chlamydomonas reinhardtii TaxID=3055 RepID=A0A2K3CVE8_CHLRE|nr:uncharacterized protein CHLRE_16g675630v5 [Chlamydomonas reinhardtii]PNW72255.1 hypothetical protein CHLRE_16g675630v5 [Chlamydomonas reinhardtii]
MSDEGASRRTSSCRTFTTSADSSPAARAGSGVARSIPRLQALQTATAADSIRSRLLGRRATVESAVEVLRETSPRVPEPRRSCLSTAGGAYPVTAASVIGIYSSSDAPPRDVSPASGATVPGVAPDGAAAAIRRPASAGSGARPQQQPHAPAAVSKPAAHQAQPVLQRQLHFLQQPPQPTGQPSLKQVLGAIGDVPASGSRGSSFTRRTDGTSGDVARQQGLSSASQAVAAVRPAAAVPVAVLNNGVSSSCESTRAWAQGTEHTPAGRGGGAGTHGAAMPLAPSPLVRSSRPLVSCRHMGTCYDQEQGSRAAARALTGPSSASAAVDVSVSVASVAGAAVMAPGGMATTGAFHVASPGYRAGLSGQRRLSRRLSCSVGMDQWSPPTAHAMPGAAAAAAAVGSPAVHGSVSAAAPGSGVLGGAGPRHIVGAGSNSHSRRRTSVAMFSPAMAIISDFLSAQQQSVASGVAVSAVGGGNRRASSSRTAGRRLSAGGAAGSSSLVAMAAAVAAATNSLRKLQRVSMAVDRPASAATTFAASSPLPGPASANARLFSASSVPASALLLRAGASSHSSMHGAAGLGAAAAASELPGAGCVASTRASSGVRATIVAGMAANASGSSYPSSNSSFVFATDGSRPAALSRAALASASATAMLRPSATGHHPAPQHLQHPQQQHPRQQHQQHQQGPEATWSHNPTFNTTGGSRARGRPGFRYADVGAAIDRRSGGRERCAGADSMVSPGAEPMARRSLSQRHVRVPLPVPLPSSSALDDSLSEATSTNSEAGFVNPAEPPAAAAAGARMGLFAEAVELGLAAEMGDGRVSRPSRKSSRIPTLEAITSGVAASAAVADDVICKLGRAGADTADKRSTRSKGFWASLKRGLASVASCARPMPAN